MSGKDSLDKLDDLLSKPSEMHIGVPPDSKEVMINEILLGIRDVLRATLQMKIQKATTKGTLQEITGYYVTPDLIRIDIKGIDKDV